MPIVFSKYCGAGNDFIIIDCRSAPINADQKLINELCHRQKGIGADGLILLENSSKADYKMVFYNCDGSEPETCGNGLRCLGKFLVDQRITEKNQVSIEGKAQIFTLELNETISVHMGKAKNIKEIEFESEGKTWKGLFLQTGVPHFVAFESDDLFEKAAEKLRHHPVFSPTGTNVNFAQLTSPSTITLRTCERGAGETLACGTGACATAVAASLIHNASSPIIINTRSGEQLEVSFSSPTEEIVLRGPAQRIFQGTYVQSQ